MNTKATHESAAAATNHETAAMEYLQTFPADVLAAVARCDVDLNALAARELAQRGLDDDGKWVGFDQAKAKTTTGDGMTFVLEGDPPSSDDAAACAAVVRIDDGVIKMIEKFRQICRTHGLYEVTGPFEVRWLKADGGAEQKLSKITVSSGGYFGFSLSDGVKSCEFSLRAIREALQLPMNAGGPGLHGDMVWRGKTLVCASNPKAAERLYDTLSTARAREETPSEQPGPQPGM